VEAAVHLRERKHTGGGRRGRSNRVNLGDQGTRNNKNCGQDRKAG
jgi:hypothetical protein